MNISLIIKITLVILFMICLLQMPYGYYQIVRFLGAAGFSLLAYINYQQKQNTPAINLYHKFGFKTVGIIPKGYFYNNEFVDERLMYED